MPKTNKPYRELKQELQEVLDWFENTEEIDIDDALRKYEHASELVEQIERYLKQVKAGIATESEQE